MAYRRLAKISEHCQGVDGGLLSTRSVDMSLARRFNGEEISPNSLHYTQPDQLAGLGKEAGDIELERSAA